MKRAALLLSAFVLSGALAHTPASAEEQASKPRVSISDVVAIPMPNRYIRSGELEPSKEQMQAIKQRVRPLMHEHYQVKIQEAFLLEKKIQKMINQKKSRAEIEKLVDEAVALKREALSIKLQVIEIFQEILTPEQWQKVVELNKNGGAR